MDITSFHNILHAYHKCRRKKRLKPSSSAFEFYMEKEIIELEQKLKDKSYAPKKFSVFVVTEPKIREIFAAGFSDRVVHHFLVDYLLPIFEPKFIFDSFACRAGKGTHFAIERLSHFLRQITVNSNKKAYYLQADVKSFFPSINHDILFTIIKKQINNPYILWLTKIIIYHDCTQQPIKKGQLSLFNKVPAHKSLFYVPKGQGLPIGNLTSQFFANIYLNELDQYVKHQLKCKYYIRYVDDFVILHEDKDKLYQIKNEIEKFLHDKLALDLHPHKWKVQNVNNGIDALGYITKPTYKLVRKRVVKTLKRKLVKFQKVKQEELDLDYVVTCINSYYAHFRHANSYKLRKHLWENHFGSLKKYLQPVNDYRYFKLR